MLPHFFCSSKEIMETNSLESVLNLKTEMQIVNPKSHHEPMHVSAVVAMAHRIFSSRSVAALKGAFGERVAHLCSVSVSLPSEQSR